MFMKHLIRKTISVLSAAVMLCGNMPRVSADEIPALSDPEWIAFTEEKTEQYDTPGLTVSAVCGADTGYRNFGYAEEGVPVTEDTVFSIASCSKAFTALSILILQEDGKLSVDDRVSDYLGWWHVTWQGAPQDTTIRQLLNHCSGIPNSTFSHYYEAFDRNEKAAYLAKGLALAYEPDTAFEYSNLGYVVLAEITETVSGMPFADYVKQEIFDPIGMTHSGIMIPAAQGYRFCFGKMKPYDPPAFTATYGDGGICTTARDMTLWLQAQLGQLPLPEKLQNAIAASHEAETVGYPVMGAEGLNYANGWVMNDGFLFHIGTNPDFSAFVCVDAAHQTGVFAAANAWNLAADCAGNALYQTIRNGKIDNAQFHVPDSLQLADRISTGMTAAAGVLVLLAVCLILTQKKRIAKQQNTYGKELRMLIVRCILLTIMTALFAILPNLIMYFLGYGFAGYRMIAAWLPVSLLIACGAMAFAFLMLMLGSVTRFLRFRHAVF